MKRRLLDYLVCVVCQADLQMQVQEQDSAGEIITGKLVCSKCQQQYQILRGIPRMVRANLENDKAETAEAFGWQWQEFTEMHQEYREQFLDWIKPIPPEFFQNKIILDAGCGIGRHTYWASRFGAKEVIGIDLSAAVETAFQNAGRLPNVHIVQADIYRLPFRQTEQAPFDFIYSIGVLHHTPDPQKSFQALVKHLQPGGTIFGWVYGYEGNSIIHYGIDPVRKLLTSRLPHKVLYYLSYLPALVLQALLKGIYKPINEQARLKNLKKYLYYNSYFYHLSAFNFRHNHTIVYDHLVAPTAFYIKRHEFEQWFRAEGLEQIELSWRNQNSWRGRGTKPQVQTQPHSGEVAYQNQ